MPPPSNFWARDFSAAPCVSSSDGRRHDVATIDDIPSIVPAYATMLAEVGIVTTDQLLERGSDRAARRRLSAETGIGVRLITRWVQQADLLRIEGLDGADVDWLISAGIESVERLGRCRADRLHQLCIDLRDPPPDAGEVQRWVGEANRLEPVVRP
ncbi:MAG: DUF4332 domain-containing protein [Acidimicrobiia bacterium]|nr:DUF4332 domain-containing protein [Acidimicrobiia bacterium]